MNLSVYLPPKLETQLSLIAQQQRTSKNAIVREVLEEWLTHHHPRSSWPPHFFDFQAVKETPDFSSYKNR
ncbi:MAG: CopG family transcriptional regulator [Proteobacteria bacterium]|nr:CopG family transcriptional regulator [Pseudomonadota bacterium]